MITFFANVKEEASNYIIKKSEKSGQLKWYMIIHVTMIRQSVNQKNQIAHPYFRSETTYILTIHDKDLEHNINSSFQKMFKSLDEFIRKGSSWSLKKIEKLEIHTASYHAIEGKSYIPLPHKLNRSKSVINVQNKDEKWFLWSVLASLHPQRIEAHRESKYKRFINSVDMSGIRYPVHPTDM